MTGASSVPLEGFVLGRATVPVLFLVRGNFLHTLTAKLLDALMAGT